MSLMLVNPRKRKTRKTRSAAQRAATARMVAARHGRAANPAKRRARRTVHAKRRHNPIGIARVAHRRTRRGARRHNPIGGLSMGGVTGMLLKGLKGAGGAVVINAVTHYLPAAVTTGNVNYLTRAALSILLGTVGQKALGSTARDMAEGALVVTIHDFINSMTGTLLPGSDLKGLGAYMSEVRQLPNVSGRVVDSELAGMGEYIYR